MQPLGYSINLVLYQEQTQEWCRHLPSGWMSLIYSLTRCTRGVRVFFSEQEYDLVTVLGCIHLALLLRKSCSVHMTVFEIVAQRNIDR